MNREDLAALNIPDEAISTILELHETDLKAAVEEVNQQHADERFNQLLDDEIAKARAKNGDIVKKLLDLETLKDSEDQAAAVRQAVADIQKQSDYLFEPDLPPPPLYAAGTGSASVYRRVSDYEAAFRDGIGTKEKGDEASYYEEVNSAFKAFG